MRHRRASMVAALVALAFLWACVQVVAATGTRPPAGEGDRTPRWPIRSLPGDYQPFAGL